MNSILMPETLIELALSVSWVVASRLAIPVESLFAAVNRQRVADLIQLIAVGVVHG
jgi:hypothetical protein